MGRNAHEIVLKLSGRQKCVGWREASLIYTLAGIAPLIDVWIDELAAASSVLSLLCNGPFDGKI
jgi:hypothetical protein